MIRLSNWLPCTFLVVLSGTGCGPSKLEQRVTTLEDSIASVQRDQALAVSRLDESNRLNQTVYLLQDRVEQMALDLERVQSGAPQAAPELNFDQPDEEPAAVAKPAPKPDSKVESKVAARPVPSAKVGQPGGSALFPGAPSASEDPVTLYRRAYDLLAAGRYADSAQLFQYLVDNYPAHDLADNAQYWLGETDYAQKNFSQALEGFRKVIENFPNGNKVPDALLKMAFSYQKLGDKVKSRETLQRIVKEFPWSEPAKKAKERLQAKG